MAGQIKGITIEFDGKTTKLEQAIKRVKNSTNDVDKALKDVNRGLKYDPKNVTLLSQKQQLLTKRFEESKQKVNVLKNAQNQLDAQKVDHASAEYQELEREIVRAEAEQKRFEKELRQLSSVKLTALGEQFKQIGGKMTEAGKSMTMYVTAPLAAVGAAGAKSFAEVDKTMQLTNSTMGNTAEQAEMLNKAMKDAAANSTYGMSDAATATLNFARAGLSAEQAASALAPAMNLAAGEGGNLDTVSGGLVATINGFGGSFDEAAQYADVFANACNNSALDIDSLSQSMSVAAPIFSAAGYKVNDAALYMGVMANKGIEANVAANSLKTGFARLVGGSADVQKQLDALGVSIVNADGSMKDTVTIQKDLHEAFAGLSESEQIAAASTIFGKNQMSNWLALINTAPDEVSALSAALDEEGTTAEMAEAMMSGFGGSLEKLKSSVDVAKTSLGEALAPIILKVRQYHDIRPDDNKHVIRSRSSCKRTTGRSTQSVGNWYRAGDSCRRTTVQKLGQHKSLRSQPLEQLKSNIRRHQDIDNERLECHQDRRNYCSERHKDSYTDCLCCHSRYNHGLCERLQDCNNCRIQRHQERSHYDIHGHQDGSNDDMERNKAGHHESCTGCEKRCHECSERHQERYQWHLRNYRQCKKRILEHQVSHDQPDRVGEADYQQRNQQDKRHVSSVDRKDILESQTAAY